MKFISLTAVLICTDAVNIEVINYYYVNFFVPIEKTRGPGVA